MSFSDRILEILDQGIEASKEFAVKTGEKARNMGELGVLYLEIKQLEGKARELVNRLGKETYQAFTVRNQNCIKNDDPEIAIILTELEKVRDMIDLKETELKNKREHID